MTTVGYGDMYPSTDLGRFVAVMACTAAITILSLVILGVQMFVNPDPKELKVFHILKFKRWKMRMKTQAAIVIQSFWRCCRMIDRPDQPLIYSTAYSLDTKLCFDVRAFRWLRSEIPLENHDAPALLLDIYKGMNHLDQSILRLSRKLLAADQTVGATENKTI